MIATVNRIRRVGEVGRRIFARHRRLILLCVLCVQGLHLGVALFGAYQIGMLEARRHLLWGRYAIRMSVYATPAVRLASLVLPETHGIRVRRSGMGPRGRTGVLALTGDLDTAWPVMAARTRNELDCPVGVGETGWTA